MALYAYTHRQAHTDRPRLRPVGTTRIDLDAEIGPWHTRPSIPGFLKAEACLCNMGLAVAAREAEAGLGAWTHKWCRS